MVYDADGQPRLDLPPTPPTPPTPPASAAAAGEAKVTAPPAEPAKLAQRVVVLIAPADYSLCPMILQSQTVTGLGETLSVVHPKDHDALAAALPSAHAVVWVWPPDKLTCDEMDWSDYSGAKRIADSWAENAPNVQWVRGT